MTSHSLTISLSPLLHDACGRSPVYENEGRNGVIEAANIHWPNVTMRVSDMDGKSITSAQVGDTLNLVFDIQDANSKS